MIPRDTRGGGRDVHPLSKGPDGSPSGEKIPRSRTVEEGTRETCGSPPHPVDDESGVPGVVENARGN